MTIFDLRCDRCGIAVVGPSSHADLAKERLGVRFAYHPGRAELSDNSSLVCTGCWTDIADWLGEQPLAEVCAVCNTTVASCLHIEAGGLSVWRLCHGHAIEFLNTLRTVEPKLDPDTFVLPEPA